MHSQASTEVFTVEDGRTTMPTTHGSGRVRNTFLWLTAFTLLSFAYYEYFQCFAKNSDDANCLLAGFDMFHGNILLKHWRVGPDHFYTGDILAYGILTRLFGITPTFLSLFPAMFWAAVVLLSLKAVLVCSGAPRSPGGIAFAFTLIGLPVAVPQSHAPMHVATLIYCLGIFLLGRHLLREPATHPTGYLGLFLLTAAAVAGDPLAVVACVLPILMTCGLIVAPRFGKKAVLVASTLVIATVTGRLAVSLITRDGGFVPLNLPMRFGDFDKFALRFHYGIYGVLDAFGINFFGKGATPAAGYTSLADYIARGPIVPLFRIPLALFAAASVWRFGRALYHRFITRATQVPAAPNEYLLHFSFWAVALTVLGAFLSEVLEGSPPTSRFFLPALVFATIMGAVEVEKRWWGRGYTFVALATSFAAIVAVYALNQSAPHRPNNEHREVAAWLQDHSLTEGYGSYWSSSIVTVTTSNRVKVRALSGAGGALAPYIWWNCNTAWYTKPALDGPLQRFVLIDRAPVLGALTEEQVIASLGKPAQVAQVGKYVVFIYDVRTTDFSRLVTR
jgi:hypothetical protein